MELDFTFITQSGTRYEVGDQHVWRDGKWIGILLQEKSKVRFAHSAHLVVAVPKDGGLATVTWTTTPVTLITQGAGQARAIAA
jgi:predicted heme/steroid binding protein